MRDHILNRHGMKWPPGFFTGQNGCACCPPPPPPPPPELRYYPRYGYAYGSTGIVPSDCLFCRDQTPTASVASKWMLEVDGFFNASAPDSPCEFGISDNCDNANGTFILSRFPGGTSPEYMPDGQLGSRTQCFWRSPTFLMKVPRETSVAGPSGTTVCYTCDQGDTRQGILIRPRFWSLQLTIDYRLDINGNFTFFASYAHLFIGDSFFSLVNPEDLTSAPNIAVWEGDHVGTTSNFVCLGTNNMSLVRDDFTDPVYGNRDAGPFCCDGVPSSLVLIPIE